MNSSEDHGSICVSIKDPHSQSFSQIMEGYLEAILHKIGPRKREIMVIIIQMIRLGFFLFIIKLNSKFNSKKNNMRLATITIV